MLAAQYWPTDFVTPSPHQALFLCPTPRVIDGDSLRCGAERVRLANIDAPEMPGHCRPGRQCTTGDPHAARDHLIALTQGAIRCQRLETDHYGRTIAVCRADDGRDLGCAMVGAGHAVERYGRLKC